MKKNVMMRVAALLLVCVMATTCGISGTFAKYVTSGTAGDTARVAKWGVTINGFGETFAQAYKDAAEANVALQTVVSNADMDGDGNNDNLLAPGTEGVMAEVELAGIPEVDVEVTYSATFTLTGWTYDDDGDPATPEVEYCPIIIYIEGESYGIDYGYAPGTLDHACTDMADLINQVETAIGGYSQYYQANKNLASTGVDTANLTIGWEWIYEVSTDNDIKDTILGDLAAAGNPSWFEFELTVTVTQVD